MTSLFLLLALAGRAFGGPMCDLEAANKAFKEVQPQKALELYEKAMKSCSGDDRLTAVYRAAESKALLFRYAEAAQLVAAERLPSDAVWRARFLLLKAELARENMKQYGHGIPADDELMPEGEEEKQEDVTRRTREEWQAEIAAAYQELWKLRRELVERPIREEAFFLDLEKADLSRTPTHWDFAAYRWTEYLLAEAPAPKEEPKAAAFLAREFRRDLSPEDAPVVQAAAILEDAATLGGPGREAARELWRLDRVLIPMDWPGKVQAAPDAAAFQKEASEALKRLRESFEQPRPKAEATLRAARLAEGAGRFAEAVALCRDAESRWPELEPTKACAAMRAQIELPQLHLTAKFAPPPGKGIAFLNTRNLPRVYLRLYHVTEAELKGLWERAGHGREAWGHLRQLPEPVLKQILGGRPAHRWSVEVKPEVPHAYKEAQADPPPVDPGLYVVAAASDEDFRAGRSLIAGAIVNVTKLLLIGSSGPMGAEALFVPEPGQGGRLKAPVFHLYALDAESGRPASKAKIEAFQWQDSNRFEADATTDEQGMAQFAADVVTRYGDHDSSALDPLLRASGGVAFWAGPAWFSHQMNPPVTILLETDRPIYRPGQQVKVKATALVRLPRGYKTYDGKSRLEFTASDPNGQELHRATLKFNAFGSAVTQFTIPTGRLLGGYSLQAVLNDYGHGFHGWHGFQVEEYKRPEFEALVNEAAGPWKFGQKATVNGEARYYFGGPVPDASVSYTVKRERYIPWFCWWWRPGFGGSQVVSSGTAKTDADGKFSFSFVPEPESAEQAQFPARFEVSIEARDAGGRTITGSRSFTAGSKAYLFEISPGAGFLQAGKPASVPVRLRDLNERPVAGKGRYALYRLEGKPADVDPGPAWGGHFPESPSLEQLYEKVPNGGEVRSGTLAFSEDKPAAAALGEPGEGAYRLVVKADDPWGGTVEQSIVLVFAGADRSALPLPAVTLAEHSSYEVGETARFLLGSGLVTGTIYAEIWGGSYLLERRALPGGVQVLKVKVTADHKGGVTVRWFGAKDFRVRSGRETVRVPWKEKELRVSLKLPKAVKPGAKTEGRVEVRTHDGKPASGEALVRVYDRSLEYYAAGSNPQFAQLYAERMTPESVQGSIWQPYTAQIQVREGWIRDMIRRFQGATARPQAPGLRFSRTRVYGMMRRGRMAFSAVPGAVMEKGMAMRQESRLEMADEEGVAGAGAPPAAAPAAGGKGAGAPAEPPVKARSDFSETALFSPQLPVAKGAGRFSFTAPERLTDWRANVSVVTKDVKHGGDATTFATRKELMVRVEMPRFYREGDEGRFQAVVHNETDRELSGEVTLQVEEDGKPAHARFALAELVRPFKAKPHGVAPLSWTIKAPRGTGGFKVRTIARSGELVDAEERDLPLLPSRERLIESALIAMDGKGKKTLELKSFAEPDPTREHESMTLQVDPQLALSIINSLPFLVRYPYECTEQVLHRYVPLAIVNAFYRKHPKLADAVRKIPKRKTLTPAWDRKDPRRLMSLMETPWENESKGIESYWPVIDLFEPKVVEEQKKDALETLLAYQLPDGGFPWFPGGRADPYMTLLVLGGFAEAMRYGVDAPEETVRRALGYAYNEIPRHLKAEPGELSLVLYAAWVVTSYPKSYSAAAKGWAQAKAWIDFADKHGPALTPLGRALAAQVYSRLGEKAKAEAYLDRAMDGSREDPIAGVYWQPEKTSWLWYHDTVETHAFLLRSLLAVRPNDRRISGMVQWLLFNRKGNEWKSTKASAAAIYSLLDVMQKRGALDQGDNYEIRWGADVKTAQVGALDWLQEPIRLTKAGSEIGPDQGKAVVEKDGPGLAFASLTWIYSTDKPAKSSGPGMIQLERKFFRRAAKAGGSAGQFQLEPLRSGDAVKVGDQVEVHLVVSARSQFEYVHLKDPRGAGFEGEALTSGWRWDQLGRYEEPRDSLTNFFMSWLPHGEYVLRYRIRPTTPGRYKIGSAVLQSMYAPEMAAHSAGFELKVEE